jgi:type I restriction enzyme S subunit
VEVRPGYKETEVGVIPEDWTVRPLSEGVRLLSGNHVLARHCNYTGDGVPYITGPADFPNGLIEHTKYTTRPGTICGPDDILVTVKGSGAGSLVLSDAEYCISRQLMAIRVYKWTRPYIYFSLLRDASQFGAAATGLIPGLSRGDILNKKLPLPPTTTEQEAIAGALSDADALIESLEQLLSKKRDLKQGAMHELLTGKKRLPGFGGKAGYKQTEIGVMPGDWGVARLGDLIEITSSKRVFQSEWKTEGIPFYRAREIAVLGETGFVDNDLFISKQMYDTFRRAYGVPRVGDLLVTGVGTLGKVYVVPDDREFYFKDGNIIWFKTAGAIDAAYLRQLYLTPMVVKQIADSSAGTTVGTYTISGAIKTMIPHPTKAEQEAIATVLVDMEAEIGALAGNIAKARDIKQGMMQKLLTGQIRLI